MCSLISLRIYINYHLVLQIFVNTFSITDFENHTLGTGLYIGASIFDHSCQPLAVANFDSTDIVIRNIREFPVTLPVHLLWAL